MSNALFVIVIGMMGIGAEYVIVNTFVREARRHRVSIPFLAGTMLFVISIALLFFAIAYAISRI